MEMRVLGASALEVSAFGLGHGMGTDDFSAAGRAAPHGASLAALAPLWPAFLSDDRRIEKVVTE